MVHYSNSGEEETNRGTMEIEALVELCRLPYRKSSCQPMMSRTSHAALTELQPARNNPFDSDHSQ